MAGSQPRTPERLAALARKNAAISAGMTPEIRARISAATAARWLVPEKRAAMSAGTGEANRRRFRRLCERGGARWSSTYPVDRVRDADGTEHLICRHAERCEASA